METNSGRSKDEKVGMLLYSNQHIVIKGKLAVRDSWQGWSRRKSSYQHDVDNCYIFVEISEMCCNFKRHFL